MHPICAMHAWLYKVSNLVWFWLFHAHLVNMVEHPILKSRHKQRLGGDGTSVTSRGHALKAIVAPLLTLRLLEAELITSRQPSTGLCFC